MKWLKVLCGLIAVISLLTNAIWPRHAMAAPVFESLGQVRVDGAGAPGSLDMDSAGNLYFADFLSGDAYKVDPFGKLVMTYPVAASGRGLTVSPDGTKLYVARKDSVVIVDVATGDELGSLQGSSFSSVGEIDLDPSGNVYVADTQRRVVDIFSPGGVFVNSVGGMGVSSGQFNSVTGITVNPAGKLVVADASYKSGRIQVFDIDPLTLAGTVVATYANTNVNSFGSPYMVSPRGIAFDDQSRGYFLDYLSSEIRATNPSFSFLASYKHVGVNVGELRGIYDVIYDAANQRLFVSCDGGRIEVLGIDGGQNPIHSNQPPSVPVTLTPNGGSVVDTSAPQLVIGNSIDEDGDALTYQIVVKQSGVVVFETTVPSAEGETTRVTIDSVALQENATFSWTVQAFDADTSSDVSPEASFVVNAIDESPSTPVLVAPLAHEKLDGFGYLVWGESNDPDPGGSNIVYQVDIANDAVFSEVVASETVTNTSMRLSDLADYPSLLDGVAYYWRVSAIDADDMVSQPSVAGTFEYDTTMLNLTSTMAGSQVYFGGNHAYPGRLVGETPLELRDIPVGVTSVVVRHPGFEPYVVPLFIAERENVTHSASLIPARLTDTLTENSRGINDKTGLAVQGAAAPFVVDFDSDGQLDLLVGDAVGQIALFSVTEVSKNGLLFSEAGNLELPVLPGAVPFVVDWNNDGRKDLLVGLADGTVRLFPNSGSEDAPAFGAGEELSVGGVALSVEASAAPAVVDYDGDGLKDLLIGDAFGRVTWFKNSGSDAAPQFDTANVIITFNAPVVPLSIDWDSDGVDELMVTTGGDVYVYSNTSEGYVVDHLFEGKGSYHTAFPLDINGGKGKEIIAGSLDGRILLLDGVTEVYVDSFTVVIQEKIDELGGLVADEYPEKLSEVANISVLVAAGDYDAAKDAAKILAESLPVGSVQNAAYELVDLFLR